LREPKGPKEGEKKKRNKEKNFPRKASKGDPEGAWRPQGKCERKNERVFFLRITTEGPKRAPERARSSLGTNKGIT
jgi:hypothetical protein